eukprot:14492861-Heterocapsa_arctica.AAC.1
MKAASTISDIYVLRIINAPTPAAIASGLDDVLSSQSNILMYDSLDDMRMFQDVYYYNYYDNDDDLTDYPLMGKVCHVAVVIDQAARELEELY